MRQLFLLFLLLGFGTACQSADVEPSVSGLYPQFGLLRGGDRVVIRGENLAAEAPWTVYFGSDRVTVSGMTEDNHLWVNTPSANKTGKSIVRLVGSSGVSFVIDNGFEYVRSDKMAECVNISRRINGTDTKTKESDRK